MKAAIQYVGEEKYPEDGKHDEKFYQNNNPQCFTPCKILKSFNIHSKKTSQIFNFLHKNLKMSKYGVKLYISK